MNKTNDSIQLTTFKADESHRRERFNSENNADLWPAHDDLSIKRTVSNISVFSLCVIGLATFALTNYTQGILRDIMGGLYVTSMLTAAGFTYLRICLNRDLGQVHFEWANRVKKELTSIYDALYDASKEAKSHDEIFEARKAFIEHAVLSLPSDANKPRFIYALMLGIDRDIAPELRNFVETLRQKNMNFLEKEVEKSTLYVDRKLEIYFRAPIRKALNAALNPVTKRIWKIAP